MFVYDTFVIDSLYDEIDDLEDELEFADENLMLDEKEAMTMEELQQAEGKK